MKKTTFFVLIVFLNFMSCNKNDHLDKEFQWNLLMEEISYVLNEQACTDTYDDLLLTNSLNPFDGVGSITGKITFEILNESKSKKIEIESLKQEFINRIYQILPETISFPDTVSYLKEELVVENLFLSLYIEEGFDIYRFKSKKLENILNESKFFDQNQKRRLLMFSSVLRHTIGYTKLFFEENGKSKSGSWEDCFVSKLLQLQACDDCWVERISCVLSRPTCLGIKALDCAIASLS